MATKDNIHKVLDANCCIGCGACAYVSKGNMKLNRFGEYIPDLERSQDLFLNNEAVNTKVCPFLSPELNEDILGENLFHASPHFNNKIGYYWDCFGAYVKSPDIRNNSTSGGFGTWLGLKLLNLGLIDGVIHAKEVGPKSNNGALFKYQISRDIESIRAGAKTRYHVLEMSGVLKEIRESEGRFLFIGVPCFVKSIRRIQKTDDIIKEKIPFAVSLVCGHYKSINWTRSLAWGAGISPKDLSQFQYRTKGDKIDPRAYVFRAISYDGSEIQKDSANIVGGKFNGGAMMPNACNYCDDVVGETADITIGDAWLPKFDTNKGGTNLLIIRNKKIYDIILESEKLGEVFLEKISCEEAIESQSGGFRQRGEGLSYRLSLAKKKGFWAPQKRIKEGQIKLSFLRKLIYRQRMLCSSLSRRIFPVAIDSNNYDIYKEKLRKHFLYLRALEIISSFRGSLFVKIKRRLIRIKDSIQK